MSKHIVIDGRIRRSSTGRYIDRLVEHLQNIDKTNRYTFLLQQDDPWQPKSSNFSVAKTKYGQFSLNPLHELGFARQLYKLKADLVHFTTNAQPIFYWRPSVTTTMDLTMLRFTRPGKTPLPIFWLKMAAYRFLFWLGNKRSKHIITISKFVKKDLQTHYPFTDGKVTVTHCASEPPLDTETMIPEGIKRPFIFYVGTAFPHKNLDKLVDAFMMLQERRPDLMLVLAGKQEQYYDKLADHIGENNISNVVLTGFIPDEELKWLYQNAEAYVFPSLSEGFGLPGLEAMVHGCPVVSSNATSLPEVYGDAAHYFDPNEPADMAEKIAEVIEDTGLRKSLISKGYAQVKKYSWKRMAEQTLAVYKSVIK
ncbi:MAG: glycosyltransferase family 1 protein [Candidatus Saccharibacteria bacterium]|nr:glycosyltransferase family 1 protein [Candidatus Saccharibacteria bacterium]